MKKIILSGPQQVTVFVKGDSSWTEYFMEIVKKVGKMTIKQFREQSIDYFEQQIKYALEVIELEIKNSVKFKVSKDGNEIVFEENGF